MAKVQAIASKSGTKWAGYYGHRRIKVGQTFEMKEVDSEGFYVDEKGKKLLFGKDGKPCKEGGEPKKCLWVAKVGSHKAKRVDPKVAAAVLSGRFPGMSEPQANEEE